jgi:hypothetical protein
MYVYCICIYAYLLYIYIHMYLHTHYAHEIGTTSKVLCSSETDSLNCREALKRKLLRALLFKASKSYFSLQLTVIVIIKI